MANSTSLARLQKQTALLLQQQAQADALFASIGEGAIATDDEGNIHRVNKAALTMLGYQEEEIVGEWFPKVIIAVDEQDELIDLINRPISRAFLTGKTVSETTLYKRKDGSVFPVYITVSPILLEGRPIGAIEVFRDISREHEIDKMKTEFIYLASHQLRTPLTAAKTYAHMLNEGFMGSLTKDQCQFMNTILNSLDRMNEIINTLLNVSRMEAGKLQPNWEPHSLKRLTEDVTDELRTEATNKNINLINNIGSSRKIKTDRILAKEIISNIISNAIKYTPGNGTVEIDIISDDGCQVVSIKDSGYGIPKEAESKLFTKFYRAPNILEKEEPGTGLGLYLIKGIAEVLGARIEYQSSKGKGTTFFVYFPEEFVLQKREQ